MFIKVKKDLMVKIKLIFANFVNFCKKLAQIFYITY